MNLSNGVDPAHDSVHDPIDVPNWSESFAFWAWDDDSDRGIYSHFQRHPQDKLLWRAYCLVFLGDQVYAHHTTGRQRPGNAGPGFESCHIVVEEPHVRWRLKVDAAGVQRTCGDLRKAPITDGPSVPITVDIQLDMRTPVWSVGKPAATTAEIMPAHYEQKGWCTGSIRVGDEHFTVDCFGANDHSHGPRDFDKLQSGGFLNGTFADGRSFTAIAMSAKEHIGYLDLGDGKMLSATHVELPDIPWEAGARGPLRIEAGGIKAEIMVEVTRRRGFFTLLAPNFEHVGFLYGENTDRRYGDLQCKLEWDGEVGAGSWEPCVING